MTESQFREFVDQLPILMKLLSDPVTPHTAYEVWSRISDAGWDRCESVLLAQLHGSDPSVIRLALSVITEQANQLGIEAVEGLVAEVTTCLTHEDRLVRMAGILTIHDLWASKPPVRNELMRLVLNDEPILAREALIVLLQIDEALIEDIGSLLRQRENAKELT